MNKKTISSIIIIIIFTLVINSSEAVIDNYPTCMREKTTDMIHPITFKHEPLLNNRDSNWTETELVSSEGTSDAENPSIDVDSNGSVHFVWEDRSQPNPPDYKIFYRMKYPNGLWTTTEYISLGITDDCHRPQVAIGPDDSVHVVWYTRYFDPPYPPYPDYSIVYRCKSSDGIWNDFEIISDPEIAVGCSKPVLDIGIDGTVHVAWQEAVVYNESYDLDILYSYKPANGEWSEHEIVSEESTLFSTHPSLDVDYENNVHIAWLEDNDPYSPTDRDILYKVKQDNESWGSLQEIIPENPNSASLSGVVISVDVFNTVHATWFEWVENGSDWKCDVYYTYKQQYNAWATTENIKANANYDSLCASLAVDHLGNVHFVWIETIDYIPSGNDDTIYYKMKTNSGEWTSSEIVSTESVYKSRSPQIAVDNNCSPHVTWFDQYYRNYVYYKTRKPMEAQLNIESVVGGLGVNVYIKNSGAIPAIDAELALTVEGGIFNRINITENSFIDVLEIGETEIISLSPIFGLGSIEITVTARADNAEEETKTADGFVLLFFILINR